MMKAAAITIVLAIALPAVMASTHTVCYNYFLEKDGCVHSAAAANERCPAPPKDHTGPMKTFDLQSPTQPPKVKRAEKASLVRRYDTTKPSFAVAGGDGICGNYDTNTQLGVCLWSGAEQKNPTVETAGWLNGPQTSNCGKRIYIQRKGDPSSVQFAPVLDGCSFNETLPANGCFDIAVTIQLFNKFKPTPQEQKDGVLYGGLTWDFDDLYGKDLAQAPN
ncbi:hypothetical protein VP01_3554g2 [Puccinia sorghi]|uniref:Secreted protein n=1 Tax=Puccinia sorghi TaxID=27349 RepID=A0A0L6UVD6_9BASI|nr:hypothetical protein VP01_3554g2 [Puccinia sorghi]